MLEKLFSRDGIERKEDTSSIGNDPSQFAPNTKIAYKPTLIPTLEKENKELLSVFDLASKAAHARIGKRSKKLLNQFKSMFIDHVLREKTSLYIYLQHSARDEGSKKAIRSIKFEMEKIGREIMQFLDYATKEGTFIDDEFLDRMGEISEILHKRIMHEEGYVYPNYRNTGKAVNGQNYRQQT